MDIKQEIKYWLQKHPEIRYEENKDSIRVLPLSDSGFAVEIFETNEGYTVGDGGWHEELDEPTKVLQCFAFGLSDRCRLRVKMRGKFPQKWTLEYIQQGEWLEDSTTGMLLFPFWRKAEIVYLQNHFKVDELKNSVDNNQPKGEQNNK